MEIKRKLASFRRISELVPIEGADKIELALIDGWQVVVKKGEFKPGELCIYFEIDSFLPVRPEFEFLRASSYREHPELGQGFRLKTVKLRGQLSQGLALPKYILGNFASFDNKSKAWISAVFSPDPTESMELMAVEIVGEDLTEIMGVQKWETPIPAQLAGDVIGGFPSFIPKTDQERIQNMDTKTHEPRTVTYIQDGVLVNKVLNKRKPTIFDSTFEVTLKLDGSSMTVYKKDGEVGVCSRNMNLREDASNAYWRAANACGLIRFLQERFEGNYAIQGELMGPGVQGNREGLKELKFFVFDVFDINKGKYLLPIERHSFILTMIMEGVALDHVPVIETDYKIPEENTLETLLKFADRESLNHKVAEGLVFKSMDSELSFKVINNNFLLNEK